MLENDDEGEHSACAWSVRPPRGVIAAVPTSWSEIVVVAPTASTAAVEDSVMAVLD